MSQKWVKTNYKNEIDGRPDLAGEKNHRLRFSHEFTESNSINSNKILDIGCGTGSFVFPIQDKKKCVGIDLEENALRIAKKYCPTSKFLRGSVLKLPFKSDEFDVVTLWEVIEHIPKYTEKKAFSEIFRVLKKNGLLILSTPNKNLLSNILDPGYFLRGHRHYNATNLMELIESCGFLIENSTIQGGLFSLIAMDLFYINKHIFHKKDGWLQNIFNTLAKKEYEITKQRFANLFIAAKKI